MAILVLGGATSHAFSGSDEGTGYFPLRKGSYWLYAAHVEWTGDGDDSAIKKADITWKSEVLDVYKEENIEAGRLRGFVNDLAWYEPNKRPAEYIVLRVGATHYHLIDHDIEEGWREIISSHGCSYLNLLSEDQPWLEVPLTVGAHFGELAQRPRNMYCQVVTAETFFDPSSIRGVPHLSAHREFIIEFRTRPDHSILGFVPHLGITRYEYAHHGTVSNAIAKLVKFKP